MKSLFLPEKEYLKIYDDFIASCSDPDIDLSKFIFTRNSTSDYSYYNIYISIQNGSKDDVRGSFYFDGNEDPTIEIEIINHHLKYDDIYFKRIFINCLAHEFRHSFQEDEETFSHNNYISYFLDEREADAFSYGFFIEKQIYGGDYGIMIDEYLSLYLAVSSRSEISLVKKTWMLKIKEIEKEPRWKIKDK